MLRARAFCGKHSGTVPSRKKPEDVKIEKVREELADVLNYAFLIADKYNLDIEEIMDEKLRINGEKYPVDKAKGSAKKYNEL